MFQARTVRNRQQTDQAAADRSEPASQDCAAAVLVQTTTVSMYPTDPASYFACNPCQINGDEVEGSAGTLVPDTGTVLYVLNIGSGLPPQGTQLVAHGVGGRLTMEFNG